MNKLILKSNCLYILSGPPASGKSTFVNNLITSNQITKDFIISSDELRIQLFGAQKYLHSDGSFKEIPQNHSDGKVFEIMEEMIKARCVNRLTTFVDATSTTDKDRARYVKLAEELGMKSIVLIFDTTKDECLARNKMRTRMVPDSVIDHFFNKMQYTSKYPYEIIDKNTQVLMNYNEIPSDVVLDIIGDTHGLYDDVLTLIKERGYIVQDGIITNPNNRKLLFLGDVVDRGDKSIELLMLVAKSVEANTCYMIRGNHDNKLYKYIKDKNSTSPQKLSMSNAETAFEYNKLGDADKNFLFNFLENLPYFYTYTIDVSAISEFQPNYKFAFVHADNDRFDPKNAIMGNCVYGISNRDKVDTDLAYETNYNNFINDYILVRGHFGSTSLGLNNSVVSLERGAAFGGKLAVLSLDIFLENMVHHLFDKTKQGEAIESSSLFKECAYNYYDVIKSRPLLNSLYELMKADKKLIDVKTNKDGFSIFKYSKKVFYDNLWNSSPVLAKARGIVLDPYGDIVQHPFDKTFNYKENNAGMDIPLEENVVVVGKVNGFLGCITLNPVSNDLLITTSGSFESDYVEYIKDYLKTGKYGIIRNYLKNNNVTLMFEVVHPKDPHIIKYDENEQGLWLIGARGKNIDDLPVVEKELDTIAKLIGVKRPLFDIVKFGEILKTCADDYCQMEGYMIRKNNETQDVICKIKSKYYLTIKFLGRMGDNNLKMMYKNPAVFKMKVDEEMYGLIDLIIETKTLVEMIAMSNDEKVKYVRDCITYLQNEWGCA